MSKQPSTLTQPHWYVVYTYPNAERKVCSKVQQLGVEAFLPLHYVVRQWSDRKKELEVPLFANYVFVRTTLQARFNLLAVQGLVRFVCFDGQPANVPELQIEAIKKVVAGKVELQEESYQYQIGQKMKVTQGQLAGMEGYLVRKNGKNRFVIQLDVLQRAIAVELPANYLAGNEPVNLS